MSLHIKTPTNVPSLLTEQTHQPQLATIAKIIDGHMFVTFLNKHGFYKIDRSVSALPDIQLGDEVIVQYIDDFLILMHRLMRIDEGHWPIQMDAQGNLSIKAGHSISLNVANSSLNIDSEGNILLKGKELLSEAESTNRIVGSLVTIN